MISLLNEELLVWYLWWMWYVDQCDDDELWCMDCIDLTMLWCVYIIWGSESCTDKLIGVVHCRVYTLSSCIHSLLITKMRDHSVIDIKYPNWYHMHVESRLKHCMHMDWYVSHVFQWCDYMWWYVHDYVNTWLSCAFVRWCSIVNNVN